MTRAGLFGLLVVAIALGAPLDASSQLVPSVQVVLPDSRALFGRHRMPAPSESVPTPGAMPRSRTLFVFVPFLVPQRSQQCAEVHVLSRLAWMAGAGGDMSGDLSAGSTIMCETFAHRLDRWPNGKRAMTRIGAWYYPNGERANAATGSWFYPDGTRARSPTGGWYYPNGELARTATGTWFASTGTRIGRIPHPSGIMVTISILERLWGAFSDVG
jgi:hypothetical protein